MFSPPESAPSSTILTKIPHFNQKVDLETGYKTKSILCAPVRTVKGEIIGVLQMLNRKDGDFTEEHLRLLEDMTSMTAMALRSRQFIERMHTARQQEMHFLERGSGRDFGYRSRNHAGQSRHRNRPHAAGRSRHALPERRKEPTSCFRASPWEIRWAKFACRITSGIEPAPYSPPAAPSIFPTLTPTCASIPAFDKRAGYFTRSILCVPIFNKAGKAIGVNQVLNRRGGPFTAEDEARLKAFTAQLAISLESARLFDQVQQVRNYNESMLQSMTNGVITLNDVGAMVTCNASRPAHPARHS